MTQEEIVLTHLKKHGRMTCWQAINEYHITRLPEIIRRLKRKGNKIVTVRATSKRGISYAIYELKGEEDV